MKKRILIVEDDISTGKIYATRFREEGFEAETQVDGAAALARLESYRPHAVLLDLDLPLVNGLEVIKQIRAQPMFQALPIIVFSNAYQHRSIEQAWKAGASMCLIKASSTPSQVVAAALKAIESAASPSKQVLQPSITKPVIVKAEAFAHAPVDPHFQEQFLKVFSAEMAQSLAEMQKLWSELLATNNLAPGDQWAQLQRTVHILTGNAAAVECLQMADLSSAFEALLTELAERPETITPSTLKTVAQTMDFLMQLLSQVGQRWPAQAQPPRVLVVDDELFARTAAESALELVQVKPTVATSPEQALELLQKNPYDLILLDVDMPGASGFDVCQQLRVMPTQKDTPVIFVTGLTSFQDRVKSTLIGGNDLIGKPYLLIELTVKALTYLLRRQLQTA